MSVRRLSRREALAAIVPLVAMSCRRNPTPHGEPPASPRRASYEGVEAIELFTGGADESAPIVVAIHGLGDQPENWVPTWSAFPGRARIAIPRAFHPASGGFSWFPIKLDQLDEPALAETVGAAEERLWRSLSRLAERRRLVVTGFSQGGILSFVLAARRGDRVAHAFPVAGFCPEPLLPKEGQRAAKVVAFHGLEDNVIGIDRSRRSVAAFRSKGHEATLREYAGVPHAISAAMRAELWQNLGRALVEG